MNDEDYISNLSDGQIDWMLNYLLTKSLTALSETSFLQKLCGDIFNQSFNDNRRKISPVPRDVCYSTLFEIITQPPSQDAVVKFMSIRIERNLIHEALVKILSLDKKYYDAVMLEFDGGTSPFKAAFDKYWDANPDFFTNMTEAVYWFNQYGKFRNKIIIKFEGMAKTTTQSIIRNTSLNIDFDDMFINMMMGAQRAVDKFSSNHGTLASYVRTWMRNAHTNPAFNHEYGNSFSVSAGERRRITEKINSGVSTVSNLSVPIEEAEFIESQSPSPERLVEGVNMSLVLAQNCAVTPNARYAFLLGDIPYYLSQEQIEQLTKTNIRR